ncbi:hypothetical protein J4408_02470 [Candidatus Pacearchaeota archaeon]|nr:hypothetical protein [Candidatus Pacearchaeota archaeon]
MSRNLTEIHKDFSSIQGMSAFSNSTFKGGMAHHAFDHKTAEGMRQFTKDIIQGYANLLGYKF